MSGVNIVYTTPYLLYAVYAFTVLLLINEHGDTVPYGCLVYLSTESSIYKVAKVLRKRAGHWLAFQA